MSFTRAALLCAGLFTGACKQENALTNLDQWRTQSVCVAYVPTGDEKTASAVKAGFEIHGITYTMEGSGIWAFCVRSEDAEKARRLLKANNALLITFETNGILDIVSRRK